MYIGYPLLLLIISKIKPKLYKKDESLLPSVSLIIPAYNEEKVIKKKIKNSLELDYQGKLDIIIASDGSEDKTVEIAEKFNKIKVKKFNQRRGKMATLNETVKDVESEIIVLTDANAMFEKDAIKKLVRDFKDESVGCVCGVKSVKKDGKIGKYEGLYWKLEKFLKEKESKIGSCVADGSIYAVRRKLYPFPKEDRIIMDDLAVSLAVINNGYRSVLEKEAVAYETASVNIFDEFRRKVRIMEGAITSIIDYGIKKTALQIVSHKILRWAGGVFMIAALISNIFTYGTFYSILLLLQMCFYSFAVIGFIFEIKSGRGVLQYAPRHSEQSEESKIKEVFRLPFYFCLTNSAQIVGVIKYIIGDKKPIWTKIERAKLEEKLKDCHSDNERSEGEESMGL